MKLAAPLSGREVTAPHTGLLRLGLAEAESQQYWRHARSPAPVAERLQKAFEERWFGSRAMNRVKYLLLGFQARFDAYPNALKTLHHWNPDDPEERRLLCHWHLQLSDPMYRQFTSTHLPERLQHPQPTLDRNAVVRWLEGYTEQRWAPATVQRMTAALMHCLQETGFAEKGRTLRPLRLPRVSHRLLGYLLYLLRETEFQGQLSQNPYLASVALQGEELERRLTQIPGIAFRRLSDFKELDWRHADLWHWAQAEL